MIPRLLLALAAGLAVVLARRSPAHRPIAIALSLTVLRVATRDAFTLPPELALALYQTTPALAAWCALRVLGGVRGREAVEGPAVLWAVTSGLPLAFPTLWTAAPHVAHVAALAMQIEAALEWWSRGRAPRTHPGMCRAREVRGAFMRPPHGPSRGLPDDVPSRSAGPDGVPPLGAESNAQACALVLLAGDVFALLGPAGALAGPWWLAAGQAGVVAAGLVVLQGMAMMKEVRS